MKFYTKYGVEHMIEVSNINPVMKNSLLATCTVHIKPWKLYLHEVTIFEKGANRWVGMPSRQFEQNGEKKYVELITFEGDAVKKRFRDQICQAVDKYLATNPDCKPEDVITEDSDFPF